MRKIKLCRIIYEFAPRIGGSITHTIELAKHMAPYCERQFVIVPAVKEDTSDLDRSFPFEVIRVKYHDFKWLQYIKSKWLKWLPVAPLINLSFGWAALKEIGRLHRRYNLDIIHTHGIGIAPVVSIAATMNKIPAVLMLDGSLESYSKVSGIYETLITKITHFDHYLVVDNGGPAAIKFQKLIKDKTRITPVYINVDTEKFAPVEQNLGLKEQLGISDEFVYISIHNLVSVQGVEYSIRGFDLLLKTYSLDKVKLLIVGDGQERAALEGVTRDLGIDSKVKFIGAVENKSVPDYYNIADVALSTSIIINMNTSTEEAMACAKPVIVFDCGNTHDHLIRHMENGILVPNGNLEELAKAMYLIYSNQNLRAALGQNARNFILETRTWEKRIEVELGVYQKLLILD